MISSKISSYSYEQWLQASQQLFKQKIIKQNGDTFDEKDHQISIEKNRLIFEKLISIQSSWTSLTKSLRIDELVKLILIDVMSIDPLRSSSFILVERVKNCLEDINKIDWKENHGLKKSTWFYAIIAQPLVKLKMNEIINELNNRIMKYKETLNKSNLFQY